MPIMSNPSADSLLDPALKHSRYLKQLFKKSPQLKEEIVHTLYEPYTKEIMQTWLNQAEQTEDAIAYQMRILRQKVLAKLICRDLLGLADLTEVLRTMSDLADVCILYGLAFLQKPHERYGQPIGETSQEVQALLIIGMGKLGGQELNVSSDIDLIFVYAEEGYTNGNKKISNHEYFTLIGKKLIQLLNDITEMGFVFRVDMRLRPFGESGPLVTSFAALEHYLITHGREWERYAWIKGRIINPNDPGLYALIRPFIYRKYLDYGAYDSMRELHREIRKEVSRKERQDNIKLGPGGIREIEFIGQVFQLIRGGRIPSLQERSTQNILNQLDKLNILPNKTIKTLQESYIFLRNLEHRLQYLDDAQTQDLPRQSEDKQRIAYSMGYQSYDQFMVELNQHRQMVSQHFDEIFILSTDTKGKEFNPHYTVWFHLEDQQIAQATLTQLGYQHTDAIYETLKSFARSSRYMGLSEKGKKRLDSLLPILLRIAATLPHPDATMERLIRLLENISKREPYLALLAEHPQLLERLATLYSQSPWASEYLTQHPILLDELLNNKLLQQLPNWEENAQTLSHQLLAYQKDIEEQMDSLRDFKHTQIFRLAVQDLAGLFTIEKISDHLSDLADICLNAAIPCVWQTTNQAHSAFPHFAIIAYGKLGGKELGYRSDLDLVFLYEDNAIDAQERYIRFAKRLINWLTISTTAGQLYDIDLRLRPNGSSGLLVSSFSAFETYQNSSAWMWEHQALTRARFVAGDPAIGTRFEQLRKNILCLYRDPEKLKSEILNMRHRINQTHPRTSDNVKYCYGGLVDIEFIVQYLILAYAYKVPELTNNSGNIALVAKAKDLRIIDATLADQVASTYRNLRRIQHASQLDNDHQIETQLLMQLKEEGVSVSLLWHAIFGESLL